MGYQCYTRDLISWLIQIITRTVWQPRVYHHSGSIFMKRLTFKEIHMRSSLQQLGQTGSLLKEGTYEHKSTYHPRGESCWLALLAQLLLVVTQGNHQGWELHVWCSGSQNAGGQKKTNWLWGCWPKISDKIFTFFSDDENNPTGSGQPAHNVVTTDNSYNSGWSVTPSVVSVPYPLVFNHRDQGR